MEYNDLLTIDKVKLWLKYLLKDYAFTCDFFDEPPYKDDLKYCSIFNDGGSLPIGTVRTFRFKIVLLGTKNKGCGKKELLKDIDKIQRSTLATNYEYLLPPCVMSVECLNGYTGGRTSDGRYYYTINIEVQDG